MEKVVEKLTPEQRQEALKAENNSMFAEAAANGIPAQPTEKGDASKEVTDDEVGPSASPAGVQNGNKGPLISGNGGGRT